LQIYQKSVLLSTEVAGLSRQIAKFVLNSKKWTMNIIVTGASRGIGFEATKIFANDPENNVLSIARGKEGLEKLLNECWNGNGLDNLSIIAFDLLKGDYKTVLMPLIIQKMQKVDILVNNAGLLINKPFEMMEDHDFDLMFQANVKTAFNLTMHLLPYFSENAHIVNIGSMGGFQGSVKFPGLSLYSASKGALAILTECMAEEFKSRHIKVNCLALGSAQTEMLEQAYPGYKSPLTAREMAEFIAEFAQTGHQWFNGKILPVAITTP
jgi:NAD(P)-dependent dehydrogenase (short-subunit alcohol dehydrogenase family)